MNENDRFTEAKIKEFADGTPSMDMPAWHRLSVALAMYDAHINKTPYCDLRETDLATIIRQVSFSGQEE